MNTFNRFFVILVCVTTIIFWCLVMLGLWTLPARLTELFFTLSRIFRTGPLLLQTLVSAFGLSAVLLSLLVLFLTGLVTANFVGQHMLRFWEGLLGRIPVVKSIYNSVKQVSDTLFSSNGHAFRQALLVQYPREGSWTIAFLTGRPGGDVMNHLDGDYVSVYVPTTPNPTSGFFLMMPQKDVVVLDMSVDEALK